MKCALCACEILRRLLDIGLVLCIDKGTRKAAAGLHIRRGNTCGTLPAEAVDIDPLHGPGRREEFAVVVPSSAMDGVCHGGVAGTRNYESERG